MDNIDVTISEIFNIILERRQSQGAFTHDEYLDLIDEVLEEKREVGEIDDDFDVEQAKEDLASRWDEISANDAAEIDSASMAEEDIP